MSPKISVIMPTRNGGKWIRESIQSVTRSTEKSLELIIIDDGSTDNSLSIIKEEKKKDERIKIILSKDEENQGKALGISKARNLGIHNAQGTYIALLDSDDLFFPKTLETMTNVFERINKITQDVTLLNCDAFLINEKGERCGRFMSKEFQNKLFVNKIEEKEKENEIKYLQETLNVTLIKKEAPRWNLPSTYFYLREKRVDFNPQYNVAESTIFDIQMRSLGQVIYLGKPLVNYRLCTSSISNTRMEERIRCTKATLKSLKEKRIFDPINPKEIPRPTEKEIITAKEGRNAKVAWVNKHYLQAIKSYTQVLLLNPKLALKKVKSFFF